MKAQILEIDCREMQPPEPMITVLSALPTLAENQKIKMLHRIIPRPLFEKLREKGFQYQVEEQLKEQIEGEKEQAQSPEYTIWIWKEESCTKD